MNIPAICEQVCGFGASHVVVTGGEPMIAPQIQALTAELRSRGLHITIETAGTVYASVACDLMSISPKLANSVPHERDGGRWAAQHERLRYRPDLLRQLMRDYEYQMKFVICTPGDLSEVESMQRDLSISSGRILLMPEGTTRERMRDQALWLVETCKQKGFRFSPRLHVDLWGDRRGV